MFCLNYKIPYKNKAALIEHVQREHPKKLIQEKEMPWASNVNWEDLTDEERGYMVENFGNHLKIPEKEKERI
jgi:hypothetical protein